MAERNGKKRSPFFQSGWNGAIVRIVAVSIVFHALVVVGFVLANRIRFERESEPVKIFELVQVRTAEKVRAQSAPRPKPKPPEPAPVPEENVPEEPSPAEDPMDLPDDMDLPEGIAEESGLNPVGYVDMDPLMQVYLERLKQLIMRNFNPPSGLHVAKSTKTSVQFTVDRNGNITDISLKRSSGNKTWDHLSVRAIRVSKLPELPPNYRAPALSLNFNFTPN